MKTKYYNFIVLFFVFLFLSLQAIENELINLSNNLNNLDNKAINVCKDEIPSRLKFVIGRSGKPNSHVERDKLKKRIESKYGAKEIKLKAKDGTDLSALLIERPNAKRVIFLVHGYWVYKEFLYSWYKLFDKDTIFAIDLRTHGDSEGDIISFGDKETQDIKAGIDFLKKNKATKKLPIIGVGMSMGSSVLLKSAYEGEPFKALILDSTLGDMGHTLCYLFNRWSGLNFCNCDPIKQEFKTLAKTDIKNLDSLNFIKNIKIPILFIHALGDRMVPVKDIEELYKTKSGPKEKWIINDPKIGHVMILSKLPDEYKNRVTRFIDSIK